MVRFCLAMCQYVLFDVLNLDHKLRLGAQHREKNSVLRPHGAIPRRVMAHIQSSQYYATYYYYCVIGCNILLLLRNRILAAEKRVVGAPIYYGEK